MSGYQWHKPAGSTVSPEKARQLMGSLQRKTNALNKALQENIALKADLVQAQNERDAISKQLDTTRTESLSMLEGQKRIITEYEKKISQLQAENNRLTGLFETPPAPADGTVVFEGYLTDQQIQEITNKGVMK